MNLKPDVVLSVFAMAIMPFCITAQQNKSEPKKVIIIEKSNKNGKVTENRQEAEGEAAEDLIKSISPEEIEMINVEKDKGGEATIKIVKKSSKMISKDDNGDKTVEITSENKDGKTIEKYKIIKKDADGEKVMEWDGIGEMPEEMKKEMGNININKNFDGKKMEIKVDVEDAGEDGKGKKMIIIGGNDGNKKRKDVDWIEKDDMIFVPEPGMKAKMRNYDKQNNNKASLGVMIDDTDEGVVITDMTDGSAAAAAGLRRGDILLKINDKYIFTSNGLINALNPYNPKETVKVKYIRDGREKSVSVSLRERK